MGERAGAAEARAQAAERRFGRVDVWINNVGTGVFGAFADAPLALHRRTVERNRTLAASISALRPLSSSPAPVHGRWMSQSKSDRRWKRARGLMGISTCSMKRSAAAVDVS